MEKPTESTTVDPQSVPQVQGDPQTPLQVKRQQIRQHFMSPTDSMFSPCSARLVANKGKRPLGLLHQTFKKNLKPVPVAEKENQVEARP